jgi:hypothetical protein
MSLVHTPLTEEELGVKLSRLLDPGTPEKLQQGFAKGLAPGFSPDQLLLGLYQLGLRGGEWREQVRGTLIKLPDAAFFSAFNTGLPARVLDFVGAFPIPSTALERLVMLPDTPGETIAVIARGASEKLCVIIGENEARLLIHPPIIEALYLNKRTPMSLAMRIIELAARHRLDLQLAAYDEMVKALDLDDLHFDDPMDAEFAAAELDEKFRSVEEHVGGLDWNPAEAAADATEEDGDGEKGEDELQKMKPSEDVPRNMGSLPIFARIRLAQLGNRFVRSQLIRDTNKLVSMAVIKSPGMSDMEVEEYSKNRQLPEDVIRYISSRKDWVKNYRVKVNLVNNPKTPVTTSMGLLSHLRDGDLRALARSKNIPQAVRSAAVQRLHAKK